MSFISPLERNKCTGNDSAFLLIHILFFLSLSFEKKAIDIEGVH